MFIAYSIQMTVVATKMDADISLLGIIEGPFRIGVTFRVQFIEGLLLGPKQAHGGFL
jgi:hypothetical protein